MKKIRILFALMLLASCLALPARADFFYMRKHTDTAVKFSPYLYPSVAMFDYPKDLTLNSTTDAPAFCGTFTITTDDGTAEYMIATNWDATQNAQVGSMFAYQGFGWGMPSSDTNPYRMDSIKLEGSGKNPSDTVCVGTYVFLTDRGAKGHSGSLTVHDILDKFAQVGNKVIFNDEEKIKECLPSGCVAHADSIFLYNGTIFVLLSVENPTNGTWENNILATINLSEGKYKVSTANKLFTKANGYATLFPYINLTGYMLLASGNTIEKVTLSGDAFASQAIVTKGIDMAGWTGHFSHIARDNNDNTYIMCKSAETPGAVTLVYKVSSTTLDAMVEGQITGTPIYNVSGKEGYPFVEYDMYYESVVWIYLGEKNTLYRYEGGNKQGVTAVSIGGDGYITGEPILSYVMNNPSDTQIPDGSGGCNAGATAAMLAFCALPFILRKKH